MTSSAKVCQDSASAENKAWQRAIERMIRRFGSDDRRRKTERGQAVTPRQGFDQEDLGQELYCRLLEKVRDGLLAPNAAGNYLEAVIAHEIQEIQTPPKVKSHNRRESWPPQDIQNFVKDDGDGLRIPARERWVQRTAEYDSAGRIIGYTESAVWGRSNGGGDTFESGDHAAHRFDSRFGDTSLESNPERRAETVEAFSLAVQAFGRLPHEQQQVFKLRQGVDDSLVEIEDALSFKTIGKRLGHNKQWAQRTFETARKNMAILIQNPKAGIVAEMPVVQKMDRQLEPLREAV